MAPCRASLELAETPALWGTLWGVWLEEERGSLMSARCASVGFPWPT
jgi:hypothetical protein